MHTRTLLLSLLLLPAAARAGGGVDILSTDDALQRWQPVAPAAAPSAPPGANGDTCINLGFLVARDGKTSSFAMLRGWNAATAEGEARDELLGLYARHAAAAVQSWRFQAAPANRKRRPVYTSATFVFLADGRVDPAPVRARCEVGDLRAYIEQEYSRKFRQGNIGKGQLERNRQQYPWEIPDGCTRHAGWCE